MVDISVPEIAFLIPAFNAGTTLAETIDSLKRQTRSDWQVIIIDDGSTDDTSKIASALARDDPRIIFASQSNAGASAARNHAARRATAPFLCMLDADDWLDEEFIDRMLQAAAPDVVVHCSYRRVTSDGRELPVEQAPDLSGQAARREFSSYCAIKIHTAIFPRALYESVGGMDTTMETCEDWDFWLRMAFAGAEFRRIDACLAFYRVKLGSLSGNPYSLVRDAVVVTQRAEDLLRRSGLTEDRNEGWLPASLSQMRMLAWVAARARSNVIELGAAAALLPEIPDCSGYDAFLTGIIIHGLMTSYCVDDEGQLIGSLDEWQPSVNHLLELIEAHSLPGTKRKIEQRIAFYMSQFNPAASFVFGSVLVANVRLGHIQPRPKPPGVDTIILHLLESSHCLETAIAPMFGELSVRSQLKLFSPGNVRKLARNLPFDRLLMCGATVMLSAMLSVRGIVRILRKPGRRKMKLRKFGGDILHKALLGTFPAGDGSSDNILETKISLLRRDLPPIPVSTLIQPDEHQKHSPHSQTEKGYWESYFETIDPWNYHSIYEQVKYTQTLKLIPEGLENAIELACAEGIFTEKLALRVGKLTATDISTRALARASERCRSIDNINYMTLDFVSEPIPADQDLIVCSEVLYYMPDEDALGRVCLKISDALRPGGVLVTAHAHLRRDEPDRTGFDWDNPFGVGTIRKVISALPGMELEATIETDLYAIHRFRKGPARELHTQIEPIGTPLAADVASHVIWGPVGTDRMWAWRNERTNAIPVLMYHRIADDGPKALARYATSPDSFREQMRLLKREGFYALTSQSLVALLREGKPIHGRPVLITFDDAYRDFATDAFPILAESGITADVFVVTEKAGGFSDWDAAFGECAPLMDWQQIADLSRKGIVFGSHLATHRPASALDVTALLREAVVSKDQLSAVVGHDVRSIALPYGITDFRVPGILAASGYDICYTTRTAKAQFGDSLLDVPRLEVKRDISLDAFAAMIGLADA